MSNFLTPNFGRVDVITFSIVEKLSTWRTERDEGHFNHTDRGIPARVGGLGGVEQDKHGQSRRTGSGG